MNLQAHIALLNRMHSQIEYKRTGPPEVFAQKLGLSERSLYRIVRMLSDQGVHMEYNEIRQSYMYVDEYTILKYLRTLGGGKIFLNYFSHCQILAVSWSIIVKVLLIEG